ncbi:hypothetical protein DCO58_08465 [Helicobacter saguini]|uniref:Alpha-1,2-fucosyltransferase n=1 Tax=Helicobacter saguini TaxID=1548018 RepID=A0A347W507_9HELI|nr:alpha-1,2-fucosyltransferase [Helicobacter saguini]MWV61643.1 hypothetical protein [Helicobacter saguini]MWV67685.1 hypothetical protein [Helicobacter saguini]MWV70037.1 hypothetical protein [Helicobacter saguini]MWV72750.1 hypothetical protein [Helicobacter saguini]TLD92739.1 alpha-1,2-fucosyltransferase [Helicobacter saguini]
MLVVRLDGGLGNQMFQYAFAKKLESLGYKVALDASWYNDSKNTNPVINFTKSSKNTNNIESNITESSKNIKTIRNLEIASYDLDLPLLKDFNEKEFFAKHDRFYNFKQKINKILPRPLRFKDYKFRNFDDKKLYEKMRDINTKSYENNNLKNFKVQNDSKSSVIESKSLENNDRFNDFSFFSGFFQTLEHISINGKIFSDFRLKGSLNKENQRLKNEILESTNSVFLHIRRGDYLAFSRYINLDSIYYNEALNIIKNRINNPKIYIFSNDIAWCKSEFLNTLDSKIIQNLEFKFVENNDEGNAINDMELMRSCNHAIIANSTFSLWAAYLIESKESYKIHNLEKSEIQNIESKKDSKHIIIAPQRFFYDSTTKRMQMLYPKSWNIIQES